MPPRREQPPEPEQITSENLRPEGWVAALSRREQPPEPKQITSDNRRCDLLKFILFPLLGPVSGFFLGLPRRLGNPFRALLKPKTQTAQHFAARPLVLKSPKLNARSENKLFPQPYGIVFAGLGQSPPI